MTKIEKIKTLVPLHEIEMAAQSQIFKNAEIPFVKKIAIMPDVHAGYDLPIGAVALVEGHISPSYVGYDIGCGMTFMCTERTVDELSISNEKQKVSLFKEIMEEIPVGFNEREDTQYRISFESVSQNRDLDKIVNEKLGKQYGTLGGGNHFIEIGLNKNDKVCITIHSGSRRPGWLIGNHYMNLAKSQYGEKLYRKFFPVDSELGEAYRMDMCFALQYALDNRLKMLMHVCKVLGVSLADLIINENHNHAVVIPGGNIIHRKGATPADVGQLGVIPGSMKSGVFITEGLGNNEYLCSASHGAGRKMSRGEAKAKIDLGRFQKQMNGIIANISKSTLDEAPDAYKNLNKVIEAQDGIVVTVIDYVEPLINIKG